MSAKTLATSFVWSIEPWVVPSWRPSPTWGGVQRYAPSVIACHLCEGEGVGLVPERHAEAFRLWLKQVNRKLRAATDSVRGGRGKTCVNGWTTRRFVVVAHNAFPPHPPPFFPIRSVRGEGGDTSNQPLK